VGNGLYQLHAIVASYAQNHFDDSNEQANQQDLRAAHEKAAQYYLQQAAKICPPREKRRGISDVQPLIEATWQYCQAEQWHEAYNLIKREHIFSDLKRWGGNAILLDLYQLLLPSGKWKPESMQAADIYDCLGKVYNTLGKNSEALQCYEKALGIWREIGNRGGEGTTLNGLGSVYKVLGKKAEALKYYEEALSIRREVGDRIREGETLSNLGVVYHYLGKKPEALSYYEQALSIRREVGDRYGEGITLWNIGVLYYEQVRYDVALACFLLARSIFEEVQSPDRGKVQRWIDALRQAVGQNKFAASLAKVELQAFQIVEQALREEVR